MMKRKHWIIVGMCLVSFLFTSSLLAADKPVRLNWVSFLPKSHIICAEVQKYFVDKVNERGKGKLAIKFRGGPETFGSFEIPKVVQKGIVDIGMTFVGAIEPIVPGVQADMLTQLSLEEERKPGGAYDFLLNMYKERGLYYLGRGLYTRKGFFYTWLRNKRVEKLEDLKGLNIGGTTAAQAPALAWGCTYTPTRLTEAYTAMERGVVDGLQGSPPSGIRARSTYEVTKYVIDHPIYSATPRVFVNLKKFNSLSKELQDLLVTTFIEAEKVMAERGQALQDNDMRWMVDKGYIEKLTFSPEDAKKYVDLAYKGAWEYQQKRFPEITPKLKALFAK